MTPPLVLGPLHRGLQNPTWDAIPFFGSTDASAALCGRMPIGAIMFTEQHQDQELNSW